MGECMHEGWSNVSGQEPNTVIIAKIIIRNALKN